MGWEWKIGIGLAFLNAGDILEGDADRFVKKTQPGCSHLKGTHVPKKSCVYFGETIPWTP